MNRRAFLLGAVASGACRRASGRAYTVFAYVANSEGGALAVVDLAALAVARHVPLAGQPHWVIAHPERPEVYVALDRGLQAVDTDTLQPASLIRLPAPPTQLSWDRTAESLWALVPDDRSLVRQPVAHEAARRRFSLPSEPAQFRLSPDGELIAVTLPYRGAVALLDAGDGKLLASMKTGGEPSGLLFRRDGKVLLVADRAQNSAVLIDVATRRVAVRLPLGLRPDFLCVNADGGQIFVSGEGLDAVVAVYPYQTEIGSTMLAGRAPGVMAASASGQLFVANPASSTVTILNIATQRLMAAVNVGRNPCHISITPDGEYALVLNKDSGDMSVLHIPTISGRRTRAAALLTDIPVGSGPVSAAIRIV